MILLYDLLYVKSSIYRASPHFNFWKRFSPRAWTQEIARVSSFKFQRAKISISPAGGYKYIRWYCIQFTRKPSRHLESSQKAWHFPKKIKPRCTLPRSFFKSISIRNSLSDSVSDKSRPELSGCCEIQREIHGPSNILFFFSK